MFFSHYWRRREPPVYFRCDYFHSAFIAKVKKHVFHTRGHKFVSEKHMVFALCQFTESQHMFFLTIGGDGSRQVGSDALIFIRLLQQKSKNISSIHIGKNFYRKNKWFLHFANLLNHSTCFFFHYWRRREPPVSLRGGDFHSAFIVYGHFLFFV